MENSVIYKDDNFESINENVYQYLKNNIIKMKILPGTKLVESQIAQSLNVSRSPVRMAIQRLEDERLVIRKSSKNVMVSYVQYKDCLELMEARRGIEGYGAYYAARRITDPEIEKLKLILFQLKTPENYTHEEYAEIHASFIRTIMEASRNSYLLDAYTKTENAMFRFNLCVFKRWEKEDFREYEFHLPVYNAIKNRSPHLAMEEMITNIEHMTTTFHFMPCG